MIVERIGWQARPLGLKHATRYADCRSPHLRPAAQCCYCDRVNGLRIRTDGLFECSDGFYCGRRLLALLEETRLSC